jgi:hypothetical protein
MMSASFERSLLDSITTLNIQLESLRNSSQEVVKSLTKLVTTIDKVDRDMTARFRVLKKEIESTRSGFGKMSFATAAALPTGAALAAAQPRTGKVATPYAGGGGGDPDKKTGVDPLDLLGVGAGLGGKPKEPAPKPGAAAPKTGEPIRQGGANLKDRMTGRRAAGERAGTIRPPTSAPPKLNIEVPGAKVTMQGAPTKVEAPAAKPAVEGAPKKVGSLADISKKTVALGKSLGTGLGKIAGPLTMIASALDASLEAKREYDKYQETGDKKHLKRVYEIAGSEIGGQVTGLVAGVIAGGALGSIVPGAGSVIGGLVGGVAGAIKGADEGLIVGRAAYLANEEGVPFADAFALESLNMIRDKKKNALDQRLSEMGKSDIAPAKGVQEDINRQTRDLAETTQKAFEKEKSISASMVQGPPAPPPSGSAAENKEEKGESGSTAAQTTPEKPEGAPTPTPPQRPSTPAVPTPPPRPTRRGPTVVNNTTTNNSKESAGGETNNVVGQNLPMVATDPFMQEWIARQNVIFQ